MKKLWLVLFLLAFSSAQAADRINCDNLFPSGITIAASGVETPPPVSKGTEGFFSLQPVFTGTGVLKIEYQTSNDGKTWSPAVEVVAAAVSGTMYPYPASGVNIFAGFQRLIFTETGAANSVVITGVYRCAQ